MNTEYIIGIDLGTTYSCAAIWKNGSAEIIPNHETGERVTPSVVSFSDKERLIGQAAKNQITKNYANTIYDSKRLIGRKFDEESVQKDMKLWPFKVEKDPNTNRPLIVVTHKKKIEKYPPEVISSMILGKVKEIAEEFLGTKIEKAIITVPAYFNESQREATRDAGRIAKLNVLKIINEPTAAALAYGINDPKKSKKKNLFIFDLGGGTFDVSIVTVEDTKYTVKATNGDTHLGGEDFDNLLIKYCIEEFKQNSGVDITYNQRALRRLKVYCEKAKRDLSSSSQVELDIDALAEGEDFNATLTRANFEHICQDMFDRCIPPMEEALKDANMTKNDIDDVILIGGSTRIPKIQEMVKNFFEKKELCKSIHPDEAVAYGAAVQATLFNGNEEEKKIEISDINPLSLGVNLKGDRMNFYIQKGMKIPTKVQKVQKTARDNQQTIAFKIYQGERQFCKDNTYLGEIRINGLRAAPKGEVKFKITMELDENSILKVNAKEINGEHEKDLNIQNFNDRLTKEEIERFLKEEEKFKEEDINKKKRVEEIMKLQNYIFDVEKKIKNSNDENKDKIMNKLSETNKWLNNNKNENYIVYRKKREELDLFLKNLK